MRAFHYMKLAFMTWILCFFTSCSKDEDHGSSGNGSGSESTTYVVNVTSDNPVLPQTASTGTITFNVNGNWTASSDQSWCKVTPTSGNQGTTTITISCDENTSYDERNATVTITCGKTSKKVTVTQKQKDALLVTSNKVEVEAAGGEATIEVKANVYYTYHVEESAKSWIAIGGTRALTTKNIILNITENEDVAPREGKITISSSEFKEEVTVYQQGASPSIVLTTKKFTVVSGGETIKVELKSNTNYSVKMPDVKWITESSTRAMSSYTHYFKVAGNNTYDNRSANIIFYDDDSNVADTVTVTQMQKDAIIVAQNEYNLPAEKSQLDFSINTNVEFDVATSDSWIKQVSTRALETKNLHFDVEENTNIEGRTGTITLTCNKIKQTITVNQEGYINLSVSTPGTLGFAAGSSVDLTVTSSDDWKVSDISSGIKLDVTSGTSADKVIKVTAAQSNETNESKKHTFTISTSKGRKTVSKEVTISQLPAFEIAQTVYELDGEVTTLKITFTVNSDKNYSATTLPVKSSYDEIFKSMRYTATSAGVEEPMTRASYWVMSMNISANATGAVRTGLLHLVLTENNTEYKSVDITVIQKPANVGRSSDFSEDGKTFTLQSHSKGAGVPIVLLGDGFLDKDISDGTYKKAMKQAYNYLFTVEPMKSLQSYFDVYYVNAVSTHNKFGQGFNTAFSSVFEGNNTTGISGDDSNAVSYAEKISDISSSSIKSSNMLILIVLNDTRYAGTCAIYIKRVTNEIPRGYSIAYIPMTDGTKHGGVGFEQILHHEAIGHGLGKLADEYDYQTNGTLTSSMSEYKNLVTMQGYGMYRNVSVYSDVTKSYWAHLAEDSRYSGENLGCYVGAYTYYRGVYRPTENSIMRHNTDGFNAPSREAIYKRVMMIANDGDYTYNYDDFVEMDEVSWSNSGTTRALQTGSRTNQPPLGRPKVKFMMR